MVRRPSNWNAFTDEAKTRWLQNQNMPFKAGRKAILKENDKERVWSLFKKYGNKSLVAELLGVNRRTLVRYLKKHPLPDTFVVKENMQVTDYQEIKVWLKRMEGFATTRTIQNYMSALRKFYEYMKEKHPERAKPSLWNSDDINEFVYSLKPHLWHWAIVPLRSLALKAQTEFPIIDLGLLPTKRTHKAKRSLAGKKEYYYSPEQVTKMIEVASTRKAKALIAFLYNTACRVEALTNMRIENLRLGEHMAEIKDKGAVVWIVRGLTDKTVQLVSEYLEERDQPKSGWLFVNGNNNRLTRKQVNDIIRKAGQKAEITGKVLTSKSFRKSFVKNAFDNKISPLSLIGTGKERKTCMCVGWTSEVIFKHYAPQMIEQIEEDRQRFLF